MKLEVQIKQKAREIGFDLVGITSTERFEEEYQRLKERKAENTLSPFLNDDIELLTTPKKHMKSARSIIALALSYAVDDISDNNYNISIYAQGKDYHRVMETKMNKLSDYLENIKEGVKTLSYVDTGPLLDRAIAHRAGLGWIGKNNNLINPKYGSFLFIGEIITNLELNSDTPMLNQCGECRLCLDSCPSGALEQEKYINSKRCIGYLTQKKSFIPEKERKMIGQNLWGCDICQMVCPHNQDIPQDIHREFKPHLDANLESILNFSKKKYPDNWKYSALSWRGVRILKRNALIIIGNKKLKEFLPKVHQKIEANSPIIRGYAVWAAGEIGDVSSVRLIKKQYKKEKNNKVIYEMQRSFDKNKNWGVLDDKNQN